MEKDSFQPSSPERVDVKRSRDFVGPSFQLASYASGSSNSPVAPSGTVLPLSIEPSQALDAASLRLPPDQPQSVRKYAWGIGILLAVSGVAVVVALRKEKTRKLMKRMDSMEKLKANRNKEKKLKGKRPSAANGQKLPRRLSNEEDSSSSLLNPEKNLRKSRSLDLYSSLSPAVTIRRALSLPEAVVYEDEIEDLTQSAYELQKDDMKSFSSYYAQSSSCSPPLKQEEPFDCKRLSISSYCLSDPMTSSSSPLPDSCQLSSESINKPSPSTSKPSKEKQVTEATDKTEPKVCSLDWAQIRTDISLLACILMLLIYVFYFSKDLQEKLEIPEPKPFSIYRSFRWPH